MKATLAYTGTDLDDDPFTNDEVIEVPDEVIRDAIITFNNERGCKPNSAGPVEFYTLTVRVKVTPVDTVPFKVEAVTE